MSRFCTIRCLLFAQFYSSCSRECHDTQPLALDIQIFNLSSCSCVLLKPSYLRKTASFLSMATIRNGTLTLFSVYTLLYMYLVYVHCVVLISLLVVKTSTVDKVRSILHVIHMCVLVHTIM